MSESLSFACSPHEKHWLISINMVMRWKYNVVAHRKIKWIHSEFYFQFWCHSSTLQLCNVNSVSLNPQAVTVASCNAWSANGMIDFGFGTIFKCKCGTKLPFYKFHLNFKWAFIFISSIRTQCCLLNIKCQEHFYMVKNSRVDD